MHNVEDRVANAYSRGLRRGKRRALTPLVKCRYRCQGFVVACLLALVVGWLVGGL